VECRCDLLREDDHAPGPGEGQDYLDRGEKLGRHISAKSGCNLILKDIGFTRGFGVNKGGAVDIEPGATGTFINVDFTKNEVNGGGECYGGAVRTGGTSVFTDCTFNENKARNGGAVGVENSLTTFNGNTFYKNHATFRGGAVMSHNHHQQTNYNDGNTFTENHSDWKGGGIYQDAGQAFFTGTNTFTSNTANVGAPQCFGAGPWGSFASKVVGFDASTGIACSA
jgi:hypothetical protein